MSALDTLVTPSRVEAFGRVLLEAMAAGTPVIASQVGGIPEVISEIDMGILIPPESPEKLAKAMVKISNDPDMRSTIIEKARARVESSFTIESHTKQVEAVYDHFLK